MFDGVFGWVEVFEEDFDFDGAAVGVHDCCVFLDDY